MCAFAAADVFINNAACTESKERPASTSDAGTRLRHRTSRGHQRTVWVQTKEKMLLSGSA